MPLNIAEKIKMFRKLKGLNQQTLSNRTGLARSYVSLIESGKKIPAVATLGRIADALGVRPGEMFEDTDVFYQPHILPVRKICEAYPEKFEQSDAGYLYHPLAREKARKIMDPFLIQILPGSSQKHDYVHSGEEFNYVIRGTMKFIYGGEEFIFEEGDCFYCDSSVPHNLEAVGKETVCLLSITAAVPIKEF